MNPYFLHTTLPFDSMCFSSSVPRRDRLRILRQGVCPRDAERFWVCHQGLVQPWRNMPDEHLTSALGFLLIHIGADGFWFGLPVKNWVQSAVAEQKSRITPQKKREQKP